MTDDKWMQMETPTMADHFVWAVCGFLLVLNRIAMKATKRWDRRCR